MSYYTDIICSQCSRVDICEFPCNDYADYMYNKSLKNNINESESNNDNDGNDIENFLEYDVSDNIWLKIINKEIPIIEILDENAFYEYFTNENVKYCDQEGLCSECRTPLKEFIEYEDGIISERYWACGNGC